jgi:hypothetical protein
MSKTVKYILQPKDLRCTISGVKEISNEKELDEFCNKLSRVCKKLSWRDAGEIYNSRKKMYDSRGSLNLLGTKISSYAWTLKVSIS